MHCAELLAPPTNEYGTSKRLGFKIRLFNVQIFRTARYYELLLNPYTKYFEINFPISKTRDVSSSYSYVTC